MLTTLRRWSPRGNRLLLSILSWLLVLLLESQSSRAASLFGSVSGTKLIRQFDADSGAVLNSFPLPDLLVNSVGGEGLAWGGNVLFVASIDLRSIQRLDPATGELLGSLPLPTNNVVDTLGHGMTSTGPTLFTSSFLSRRIYLLNPETGEVRTSFQPAFTPNGGMDYSPTRKSLFVSEVSGVIHELDPETGVEISSFATGARLYGIGFIGSRMFVSQTSPDVITERNPATGAIVRSFTTAAGNIGGLAGEPVPEPAAAVMIGAAVTLGAMKFRRRC